MYVQRFYDDRLAQASYLIGCQQTGEAIVIDPPRDASPLIAAAAKQGLTITAVTETHIHADFVSGARELAARTGAKLMLSAEGGPDWQYRYADDSDARHLHDNDLIQIGNIRIQVRHTPGHTPEHLAFVVVDGARSEEPVALVSGDFVFVGDVGRPDLLERAAHQEGTMELGARDLFRSLRSIADLPDFVQVWPGHGAGSACGKALGAVPTSTLGYERRTNWAFGVEDEPEFVRLVLEGQPSPPRYFAMMKHINREGPPILGERGAVPELDWADLPEQLASAIVVDVRPAEEYLAAHLPGTISLPLIKAFTTWAGWLLPYEAPISVLAGSAQAAEEARRALASIGLDRVRGWIDTAGMESREDVTTGRHGRIDDAAELLRAGRRVIDLREPNEWQTGHVAGAEHHPLGMVMDTLAEVDHDTPLAIHCQSGIRSGIAASVLERMGFTDVIDLADGYGGLGDG